MALPASGTPGVFDPRNPTLIPNVHRPVVGGAPGMPTMGLKSPASFLADNARADATAAITIGGTATPGDIITLVLTSTALPAGSLSFAYTVASGDTVTTIAEGLAALVNADLTAQAKGIRAYLAGTNLPAKMFVAWPGPIGNFAVISRTLSGGASVTGTLAPSNGVLSGGSGPVFAGNNFTYSLDGNTQSFYYGNPYVLGLNVITAMVRDNMPIV